MSDDLLDEATRAFASETQGASSDADPDTDATLNRILDTLEDQGAGEVAPPRRRWIAMAAAAALAFVALAAGPRAWAWSAGVVDAVRRLIVDAPETEIPSPAPSSTARGAARSADVRERPPEPVPDLPPTAVTVPEEIPSATAPAEPPVAEPPVAEPAVAEPPVAESETARPAPREGRPRSASRTPASRSSSAAESSGDHVSAREAARAREGTTAASSSPMPPPQSAEGSTLDPAIRAERELFERAHRLHFGAAPREQVLAAWDAYLQGHPAGRYAPEARYNRALTLVRLGRTDAARSALSDLARRGYRAAEVTALLEAMDSAP